MARAGYPKDARLRLKREYRRVMAEARFHPGRECLVRILENACGRARLGISVPARYGNAIRRNRFRRLAREAFREVQHELGALDILVSPRKHLEEPTLAGIRADLRAAPQRAREGRRQQR